ncbi:MAG: DUF6491 family protein [Solimonas sp.]
MSTSFFRAASRHAAMAAAVVGLLAACASSPPAQKPKTLDDRLADRGYKLGGDVQTIMNWNVDGWAYVDDGHVVFNAGPSRDYLLTVDTTCTGLRSANAIAFTSTVDAITKFDKLIVRNNGFSDQCQIRELHELKRIKKPS